MRPASERYAKDRRLIRSATLNGYAQAAREAGLDPIAMLKEVDLPQPDADEPDRLISLDSFLTLLVNSAERSGLPDFGIRAANARGIPDLGTVTLLMREAENVETAIHLYTSHLRLHSDGTIIHLDTRFDDPIIVIEVAGNTKQESRQGTQFCVTGVLRMIRWLIGEDYRPELVCFSHPKPVDTQMARSVFQCEVRYNQILSGIVLDQAVLRRPLVTSPPFLRKLAMRQLQPLLNHGPDTFGMKVSRLISQGLSEGDFSSETVAEQLAMDRRTLNRRLAREGTTYSSLLQTIRLQVVRQALDSLDQSLTELACAAGFQSLSAFSRWFQNAFGCSATEWRNTGGQNPYRSYSDAA